jgi:hypothetical protein
MSGRTLDTKKFPSKPAILDQLGDLPALPLGHLKLITGLPPSSSVEPADVAAR